MTMSRVPLVNLSDFHHPTRRAAFVRDLGDALRDLGFVRVTGHALDEKTMEAAYAAAARFFALPDDVKRAYLIPGGAGQRGYTPFKAESAKGARLPDLKEFWHVGRELSPGHRLSQIYPENIWPAEVPEFRSAMRVLFRQLEASADVLLGGLALYLGLEEDHLAQMSWDGNTILRVLHYPALAQAAPEPGAIRAAAHEDINLITLLITSTASGLQLLTRSGEWLDVNALPGEIVADSGDMISRLTNGLIPATTHRVINPGDSASNRFSMPFFVHPRPEVSLRVLDRCRGDGFPPPPPDISAQAYLDERLEELGLKRL